MTTKIPRELLQWQGFVRNLSYRSGISFATYSNILGFLKFLIWKILDNQAWKIHICGESQLKFQIVKILLKILNKVYQESDCTYPISFWTVWDQPRLDFSTKPTSRWVFLSDKSFRIDFQVSSVVVFRIWSNKW